MNTFKKTIAVTIAAVALGGFASTQAFAWDCEHDSGYSSYQPPRHVEYNDSYNSDYAPPRRVEYGYNREHRRHHYFQNDGE